MGLFGKETAKEAAKEQKRELKGATRDVEKDLRALDAEEQKLQADIKAAAKRGDVGSARIMAKQLVRLRETRSRMMMTKSTVTSADYRIQSVASQSTMTGAMATATRSLAATNQRMNLKETQAMMNAYGKESMKMEMGAEMMDEAFDHAFEGDEAMEGELMDKIYDEIGIEFAAKAGTAPMHSVGSHDQSEADLEARLRSLAHS